MPLHLLHPNYLWFLFILLIPVIIHLFNFKRFKKIYFSNLRFLQNINSENKRKSKLKNLLILLFRILALGSVIIAFAQPIIPDEDQSTNLNNFNQSFCIYIDNSFSMNGDTEKGNALELAKNLAIDLVKSLPDYSKIRIYNNDILHQINNLEKNQAIAKIQEIEPSPVSHKLSSILKNINIDLPGENSYISVFSDFQAEMADFNHIKQDSTKSIDFIQLKLQPAKNLSIDSCWFEKENQDITTPKNLLVKVSNHSNEDLTKIPIQLYLNDSIKSVGTVDISKNSSQITQIRYISRSKGFTHAKVQIEDYPITHDNSLYFSYNDINTYEVLCINQNSENVFINKLYTTDSAFRLKNIQKSNLYNENLSQYQLIILNEFNDIESGLDHSLKAYLKSGGNVLFIPDSNLKSSLNNFLSSISAPNYLELDSTKQRISKIESNTAIYKDVFQELKTNARLPDIYKFYKFSEIDNSSMESIWQTAGGENLFTKVSFENGNFFQLGMNLNKNWTNLTMHPIFIPSLINLCKSSSGSNNIYYQIGKNQAINTLSPITNNNESQFHIINENLKTDIIPQQSYKENQFTLLYAKDQIRHAGNYNITLNDSIVQAVSFNYLRSESNPNFLNFSDIEMNSKRLNKRNSAISHEKMKQSELNHEKRKGIEFWKILIIMALVFFITEGILKK